MPCEKCGAKADAKTHTETYCAYHGFLKLVNGKGYEAMTYGPDLQEVKAEGRLPVETLDLHVNPQDKNAGMIRLAFVPKWLKEGVTMYYNYQMADMTLLEFLQKMYP